MAYSARFLLYGKAFSKPRRLSQDCDNRSYQYLQKIKSCFPDLLIICTLGILLWKTAFDNFMLGFLRSI